MGGGKGVLHMDLLYVWSACAWHADAGVDADADAHMDVDVFKRTMEMINDMCCALRCVACFELCWCAASRAYARPPFSVCRLAC